MGDEIAPQMDEAPEQESDLVALAGELGELLKRTGLTCAAAESCTGGLVGHLITEIPGSSAYFSGSAVVYSYAAKERILGVEHETLVRHGAVSYEVAQQMAQGALRLFDADVAVAITGIAGPGGGTPDKPVGTVHFHLSAADGAEWAQRVVWSADRRGNKLLSARHALQLFVRYCESRG
jgi:PncC family amidohydrolase